MFEDITLTLVTIVPNCAVEMPYAALLSYFFSFLHVLRLCNHLGYDRPAT